MKRIDEGVLASYLIISILAFRHVLASSGSIGLLHDWSIPIYSEQLSFVLDSALYSWYPYNLGTYSYNTDAIFKLLLGTSSFISTPLLFKLSLVLILFISGASMYWLSKELIGSSDAASALAGLFYMLSPVLFTRVIVGYYYYLIGYALLPIILYSFVVGSRRRSLWHLLLCSLLFGISAMQLQFPIIIVLMLILYILMDKGNVTKNLIPLLLVLFGFCLLQMPTIFFFASDILKGGQVIGSVTGSTKYFWLYFFAPSLPQALMLFGKDYEFLFLIYFQNKYLFVPFLLAAVAIPIACFASFRLDKAKYYILLAIIAIFFMKGPNPPFGFIYQLLYEHMPLSSLFRTSYHWSVLVVLSYSVLLGISYDSLQAALGERGKLVGWLRDYIFVSFIFLIIYAGFALSNYLSLAYSLNKRGIPAFAIYLLIFAAIITLAVSYIRAKDLVCLLCKITRIGDRKKNGIFLIFLVVILIYSWPIFSGDFAGRLQTYQYDEDYHDLYKQIQEETSDFRVFWIPVVQPMIYNNSQYSGHDVLISYPPKPSFDQDLAAFSDQTRLTAFMANLIYSNNTEYFGDILDITSTKYAIYRNDFESKLPMYLPFGSVQGFNWSKDAPLNFLVHQKDLHLKTKAERFSIYENDYLPHISMQKPVLVGGSLSTMISLSYCKSLLGFEKLPTLLFLDEKDAAGYWNLSDTIVLDGDSYSDSVISFLDPKYKFDAGGYARDLDARIGWTTTFGWWWYDLFASSQLENGALSLSKNNSTLEFQTGLKSGKYAVLVKARSGTDGENLRIASDGLIKIIKTDNHSESYVWHDLGIFNITDGKIAVTGTGKNAVQRLVVVPQCDLAQAYADADRRLDKCKIILVSEFEQLDKNHSKNEFGCSQGYLNLSKDLRATITIFIPKNDTYNVSLRASSNNGSSPIVYIDGKNMQKAQASGEFEWLALGEINLVKGYHRIEIKGDSSTKLDQLLLKSSDLILKDSNGMITIIKNNSTIYNSPTRYLFKVTTNESSMLTFSESYHPGWILYNSRGVALSHFKVNGYANGYEINGGTNESMTLEFSKQGGYSISILIMLLSCALIALFLLWKVLIGRIGLGAK
jgi:hypothetical protein